MSNSFTATQPSQTSQELVVQHPVPNGQYKVRVNHVCLKPSRNKGTPQLMWVLEVEDDSYKDVVLYRFNTINEKPTTLYRLTADLQLCGVSIANPLDLEKDSVLERLMGLRLLVLVVNHEKGYTVHLQKKL